LIEEWTPIDGLIIVELSGEVLKPVRCFIIEHRHRYILVDTGYRETSELLLKKIAKYHVTKVVLTHLHIDHSGGAAAVRKVLGAPIAYHEWEFTTLKELLKADSKLHAWLSTDDVQAVRKMSEVMREVPYPDEYVQEGFQPGGWRVIHTPGHTPGHIIFAGEEAAITGDTILQHDTSNVAYVPIQGYHPLTLYLKNIVMTSKLGVKQLIPSHGPIIKDPRTRVAQIFDHHYQRLRETVAALQKGLSNPVDVAREITWSKGSFDNLNTVDKWLALLETLSHIDFLVEHNLAKKENTHRYSLTENYHETTLKEKLTQISQGIWIPHSKTY